MPSVIVIERPARIMLPGGVSVMDRLVEQIQHLAVEGQVELTAPVARVPSGDLDELSRLMTVGEDVVLIDGGSVMQTPALRAVLGDDRITSGLLVSHAGNGDVDATVALDRDGKVVVSAGSVLHTPPATASHSLGVLRLDAAAAARVAQTLPDMLARAETRPSDLGKATLEVLTAAAVEAGVRLRPVDVRKMQAFRPSGPSDAVHALRRCEDRDEDRAWLDAAVKAKDGWFTTFFVSPYSRYVAKLSARIGLSPNQVTALSALVGAGAAAAFAVGTLTTAIVGAVALQIAFMLDCVDGQLSRYTQRFSTFGAWLDSMLDRGKELLVYLGLAIGGIRADEPDIWILLVASAALLVLRHSSDISYEAARPVPTLDPAPLRQPADHAEPMALGADGDLDTTTDAAMALASPRSRLDPRRVARSRPVKWLLRFLAFPIGERFAAISLLAVFATRRSTFLVLLGWGLIAWAANLTMKLARSRRWSQRRFGWLLDAAPRLLEYGTMVGVALAVSEARPAVFALLFAVAMRHYDEGYRARTIGEGRTGAVTRIVLGAWYARIVLLVLAAAIGVAAPVAWSLAGIVAALGAVDLVRAWLPPSTPTSDGSPR